MGQGPNIPRREGAGPDPGYIEGEGFSRVDAHGPPLYNLRVSSPPFPGGKPDPLPPRKIAAPHCARPLAQLYLKTLCVFFLSPLPRGVRGGSGLFVYQGNLLFWAESGPSGKARESLFEVWPRAGRPRNVFWESGPGPAATEPGFCQNGAAASAPRENKVFILMRSLAYMGLFGLYIYIYHSLTGHRPVGPGFPSEAGSTPDPARTKK
jgi:hypothetical protein